jgi:hypothetical protein
MPINYYEALHVSHDQPCSIDVADLADIFTVDSSHRVRNKLKISAQTAKPFLRYRRYKYEGVGYIWYTFASTTFQ